MLKEYGSASNQTLTIPITMSWNISKDLSTTRKSAFKFHFPPTETHTVSEDVPGL
jgi:hypothetical protein